MIKEMGIIELIVSVILLIAGIVMLVLSIKKIKGKKRIVVIVASCLLLAIGVHLAFDLVLGAMLSGASGKVKTDMSKPLLMIEYTTSDGINFKYEKVAKKGYSGDAIELSESKELYDFIYSFNRTWHCDTSDITVSSYDDIDVLRFSQSLSIQENGKDSKYVYYCDIITSAPDEDYVGIQYIRIEKNGEVIEEAGSKPVFS